MIDSGYPHRLNRDGSYDSICPKCFITIHSSMREEDLVEPEENHVCEPWRLSERCKQRANPYQPLT